MCQAKISLMDPKISIMGQIQKKEILKTVGVAHGLHSELRNIRSAAQS